MISHLETSCSWAVQAGNHKKQARESEMRSFRHIFKLEILCQSREAFLTSKRRTEPKPPAVTRCLSAKVPQNRDLGLLERRATQMAVSRAVQFQQRPTHKKIHCSEIRAAGAPTVLWSSRKEERFIQLPALLPGAETLLRRTRLRLTFPIVTAVFVGSGSMSMFW